MHTVRMCVEGNYVGKDEVMRGDWRKGLQKSQIKYPVTEKVYILICST